MEDTNIEDKIKAFQERIKERKLSSSEKDKQKEEDERKAFVIPTTIQLDWD